MHAGNFLAAPWWETVSVMLFRKMNDRWCGSGVLALVSVSAWLWICLPESERETPLISSRRPARRAQVVFW